MNLLRALHRLPEAKLKRLLKAKKLLQVRDSLAQQVDQLKGHLSNAESKLSGVTRRIGKLLNGSKANGQRKRKAGRRRTSKASSRRSTGRVTLKQTLQEQLKKLGRAAGATELAAIVKKAGYATKSKGRVFVQAVYQALAKGGEFRKVGPGKYTIGK